MKTVYETLVEQFGAENIYMIERDYHGRYEDDDCYFRYLNMVDGTIYSDQWSTRYGCPNYQSYIGPTLYQALDKGTLDLKRALEVLFCIEVDKVPTVYSEKKKL